jgi:nucleotide-binding universal stress UspA family protein
MPMFKTILVPLDGSKLSEQALPLAQRLAKATGARLELIRVHSPPTARDVYMEAMAGGAVPVSETTAEEEAYLDEQAAETRAEGVEVNTSLLDGPVAQAIGRRARATADLVVMTTHGRGPFSRVWLGSVADELLRILDRAILLIRPTMEPWATAGGPPYRRILLPLDAWDGNTDAVETAIALGSPKTEYVLVHVVDVPVPAVAMPIPMGAAAMPIDALESKVAERLEGIANSLSGRGLKVRTRVEFASSAAQGILDVAESEAPDLIAMATRRPGRIERMLLGSVTDKVVRASKEPVVVVPACLARS